MKGMERIEMSMSTQRHGVLYRTQKIYIRIKKDGVMETRSTNRGFV
jgi:hypothetical protein